MSDYIVVFFVGVYAGMAIGFLISLYGVRKGIKKAFEEKR